MPQPHGESNRKTCRWVVTIRLAFKLTLKPNVKIIAHGSALRHSPDTTDMWEGSPAYTGPTPRKLPAGKPLQDSAQHWSEVEASGIQRDTHFNWKPEKGARRRVISQAQPYSPA